MKDNQAKYPQLRFKGFTDPWEQHKLGEVLSERNTQQQQSVEYPLVSFTVENGVTPKTERYEREQLVIGDKGSKKYKLTKLNDIVYNPANLKFGAIARNRYGNAVFSPIYVTFVVNNLIATPKFIEMFVTRSDFIQLSLKYQQGTVYERQSVSPENLLSMSLSLPGAEEQEKIGAFFEQLDHLITLHQRKLAKLKELKQGYLQKLFPKNGSKFPQLRFAGFADAWKQRKLGESCRIGDIDHRMPKSVTEGVPYLMTGDFIGENKLNFENTKLVSIEDYDQLSKKIKPEYGDILFARYASVGAVRYVDIQRKFLISYSCAIMKPNIDIKGLFLYQLLQTDFMKRKIEFEINPNSQKNIGIDSLKKLKISIPIIEEQEKIGKFFKDLDNTIALHQRKLEKLQELKKGYLQKIFC
ncbi:restriction endonuclease subunit S [Lactiplantibacillus pentosus]|uniref:restriction endonuclease subunit S n=1 Tax=Lactiplantibacillus pentosus TaxID=1589 RepID=UPI001C1EF2ED|nr:restriction endonuclease subunit S [Lactiplantibacillus pentosus]MBU7510974.1 restriction endonuclease subunit S [Lactiplantibacillus pentosus]MBU7523924.1 restriction endonuclease subunit S [Lactiplantibacillus pentosus]